MSDLDAFVVSEQYRQIAVNLNLVEWHPVVWIGRLLCLDNDFGEHWFDNWDLREEKKLSEIRRNAKVEPYLSQRARIFYALWPEDQQGVRRKLI